MRVCGRVGRRGFFLPACSGSEIYLVGLFRLCWYAVSFCGWIVGLLIGLVCLISCGDEFGASSLC